MEIEIISNNHSVTFEKFKADSCNYINFLQAYFIE